MNNILRSLLALGFLIFILVGCDDNKIDGANSDPTMNTKVPANSSTTEETPANTEVHANSSTTEETPVPSVEFSTILIRNSILLN